MSLILLSLYLLFLINLSNALFSKMSFVKTGAFCLLIKQFLLVGQTVQRKSQKDPNFGCILNNGKLVMMGFGILVFKGKRKYVIRVILSKSIYVEARAWRGLIYRTNQLTGMKIVHLLLVAIFLLLSMACQMDATAAGLRRRRQARCLRTGRKGSSCSSNCQCKSNNCQSGSCCYSWQVGSKSC